MRSGECFNTKHGQNKPKQTRVPADKHPELSPSPTAGGFGNATPAGKLDRVLTQVTSCPSRLLLSLAVVYGTADIRLRAVVC